jgi:DNA-binding beta-propeller fold protein YncE
MQRSPLSLARRALRPRALPPLLALLCAAALGCAADFPGDAPDLTRFEHPVGVALHPSGRYLYVVSGNFDLRYRIQDGGQLSVIDTETNTILADKGLRIPSFGGEVVLSYDGSRGFVASRGGASVLWFELSEDGSTPRCPLTNDGSLLGCQIRLPGEPYRLAYTRLQRTQPVVDSEGRPVLDADGQPQVTELPFDLIAVTHLSEGLVSMITFVESQTPGGRPLVSAGSAALLNLPSDVIHEPGTDRFFVSGRADTGVITVRPAITPSGQVLGLFKESTLAVPSPQGASAGRGLLLSPDGRRLYATSQSPTALLVFDTSVSDADLVSGPRNRLIDMIDLPAEPNELLWVQRADGPPLLYITCLRDDSLIIVDPTLLQVVQRVPAGDGPFSVALRVNASGVATAAFISNFAEHTVSAFDLSDPLAPAEVAIIGGPSDLANAEAHRARPFR